MTCVREVEQGPVRGHWVGLRDLEQRLFVTRSIWVRQRELVDGRIDARVGNGPLEIPRCLAAHRSVTIGVARVAWIRGARSWAAWSTRTWRWDHLGYAQVTLGRRSQEVSLLVEVGVDV